MSGKLRYYDFFVGRLTFTTPLHVGSMDPSPATDSPLLRDAGGRIYLPGTSVAGALRSRATEITDHNPGLREMVRVIFGDEGGMSRLWVEDAYPDAQYPILRDGVAIDPRFDAAKPRAKFDMETTPVNTDFDLTLRLITREGDPCDEMRSMVFTLMEDFRTGKIPLGAAKTRGLGRCSFGFTWRVLDFSKRADLAGYLATRNIEVLPHPDPPVPIHALCLRPNALEVRITMAVDGSPFLIKGVLVDEDYDACFTTVADARSSGAPIEFIPGSSIKGVLRSRARKILLTLGGNACLNAGGSNCSDKLTQLVKTDQKRRDDRGFIDKHSCSICRLFGNGYLAGRISFPDAFFSGPRIKKPLDCVAIDRFTGGAASGKLFDFCPVSAGTVDIGFQVRDPTDFDRHLVLLLVRDLWRPLLPIRIGYGKSKGFGLLTCKKVMVNGTELEGFNAVQLKSAMSPNGVTWNKGWWQDDDT